MTNSKTKLVFTSEEQIKEYAKKLEERLENIEIQAKVINDSVRWWDKNMVLIFARMKEMEESDSAEGFDELVNETYNMNRAGKEEIRIMNKFDKTLDQYLADKREFAAAVRKFYNKN